MFVEHFPKGYVTEHQKYLFPLPYLGDLRMGKTQFTSQHFVPETICHYELSHAFIRIETVFVSHLVRMICRWLFNDWCLKVSHLEVYCEFK